MSDTHLKGALRPWSKVEVVQKFRLRLNWQQGGQLYNGGVQRDRRLNCWTWVSRGQYPMYWGSLNLTPQYKFMILRSVDRERGVRLQSEYRSVAILRLEYQLLRRTLLTGGIQGLGPTGAKTMRIENSASSSAPSLFPSGTTRSISATTW